MFVESSNIDQSFDFTLNLPKSGWKVKITGEYKDTEITSTEGIKIEIWK